jgi:hypothetical protein
VDKWKFYSKIQKMKFRARLSKDGVGSLAAICQILSRSGSVNFVIYLTDTCVRIISVVSTPDAPQCHAEIVATEMFTDYRIESQTVNTILFELNLELLLKALTSGKDSPQSVLKLVKRGSRACLCFEATASDGLYVNIVHDIPITLQKSSDIVRYTPPDIPAPTVCLELPRNRLIKIIFDRLAKFSKTVRITASQVGTLIFSVDHSSAEIKTFYTGLTSCYEGTLNPARDSENSTSVIVELKTLSQIFNIAYLPYSRAILCKYII